MDRRFIWQEIQEHGYFGTRFVQERDFPSLTEEISGRDPDGKIKVNLKLRFPQLLDITNRTSDGISCGDTVMHEWELDILLHFYAALDMYSGYNRNNQRLDAVHKDFVDGKYGDNVKHIFLKLSLKEQDIILRNFCDSNHEDMDIFCRTYKELYPSGLIYRYDKTIIVYLDKEDDDTSQCLELLRILFLPIGTLLKIHFKYHMGIIGIEDTMRIGKIRIF